MIYIQSFNFRPKHISFVTNLISLSLSLSLCLFSLSYFVSPLVVKMDMYKDDSSPYCYFHPKEEYVGVCPLCLNERLLVLASKQSSSRTKHSSSSPIISLPKIFTLSSLLSRLDLRHHRKFHSSSDLDVSTSQEGTYNFIILCMYIYYTRFICTS